MKSTLLNFEFELTELKSALINRHRAYTNTESLFKKVLVLISLPLTKDSIMADGASSRF